MPALDILAGTNVTEFGDQVTDHRDKRLGVEATGSDHQIDPSGRRSLIAVVVSSIVIVAGSAMPWAIIPIGETETMTVFGFRTTGLATAGVGLIMGTVALISIRERRLATSSATVPALCSGLVILVGAQAADAYSDLTGLGASGTLGVGIPMILIGAVVSLIVGIQILRRQLSRSD